MAPEDPSYGDRLFVAATRMMALALGESLRALRDSDDPLMRAHSEAKERDVLARLLADVVDILGSRWDRLPA